jgi:hypothetical protein
MPLVINVLRKTIQSNIHIFSTNKMPTGHVYKLVCTDVNVLDLYVGSTASLRNRRREHKSCCHNHLSSNYHLPVYQFMREHGGWVNWTLIVLETMQYQNKYELRARERYWIESLNATLNCMVPTRTKEQYIVDNKESIAQHHHEYYETNKERLSQYAKEYYASNLEHISQRAKAHRRDNANAIKAHKHEKYMQHAAELNEHVECECGLFFTVQHANRHRRSARHARLLRAKNISVSDIPACDDEQEPREETLQPLQEAPTL